MSDSFEGIILNSQILQGSVVTFNIGENVYDGWKQNLLKRADEK